MDYRIAAKELKKNIQLMESTFTRSNLQVINISCKPMFEDDDAKLKVFVELSTISGTRIPTNTSIKINLYDSEDELYTSDETLIMQDLFNGYDTISIDIYDEHTLEVAVKGRLYASPF